MVCDLLSLSVWVQGGAQGPRPQQIPRPGVEPESSHAIGSVALTIEDFKRERSLFTADLGCEVVSDV